ncbi:hypothetical protein PG999_004862 [Apiospora kogelbergensis]|uniref:Uncharacterized protein n=1 Tax=Apiospora kogelbergensis TaxID=1337665 RepID=A0AAW0R0H0_9PEZI
MEAISSTESRHQKNLGVAFGGKSPGGATPAGHVGIRGGSQEVALAAPKPKPEPESTVRLLIVIPTNRSVS